jgi:hypothetical protein
MVGAFSLATRLATDILIVLVLKVIPASQTACSLGGMAGGNRAVIVDPSSGVF